MYLAQSVEVKGDINLESVQVYPGSGSMGGGGMGFCPPPPSGDFNAGFGFPTAPPPPPLAVCTFYYSYSKHSYNDNWIQGGGIPSIHSCRINTGSRIFVRGFIPHDANRFELNLLQGFSDSDDVAFHFNPRFHSRTIVKNHRRNGQWGEEENQPFPSYMPLTPGSPRWFTNYMWYG